MKILNYNYPLFIIHYPLFRNWQYNHRTGIAAEINFLRCFLKIRVSAEFVVFHKLLRISGDEWKPGALNLHHNSVSFFERMRDARHREIQFHRRVRR